MEDLLAVTRKNMRALQEHRYPGRGIVMGRNTVGKMVQIAWITSRSDENRNRIMRQAPNEESRVIVEVADSNKLSGDPELTLYTTMKEFGGIERKYIVSNGDQTDTLINSPELASVSLALALRERKYEEDKLSTPRIIGMYTRRDYPGNHDKPKYEFAVLKKSPFGDCLREHFQCDHFDDGYGYCVYTYSGAGDPENPPTCWQGEPIPVQILGIQADDIVEEYWNHLKSPNLVSVAVKVIRSDGASEVAIRNINKTESFGF